MDDGVEQSTELFINDGVLVRSHTNKNDVDFLNNLGTLRIVEYKSDLGLCIEWHQCDISIESDDPEWAIVKDNKYESKTLNENTKNGKTPPSLQIPFKNLLSFRLSGNNRQLTLEERGESATTTFYFQNGHANHSVDFLKKYLNTSVSKRDLNFYTVRDQKEVQTLEKSFAELDLFSDDNARSDAIWSFIKKLQDNPYETTMCAFSKVTDIFSYKPPREIDTVAELLNKSFTAEDLIDFQGRISTEDYELISKGTPLPPRTLPFRSTPLTSEQWNIFFDDNGRILESEIVKENIFHGGISEVGELRSEVWKFLLGYYPWDSTFTEREALKKQKKEEYFTMKLQWKTMSPTQEDNFAAYKERKSLIEKDVCRTDRNMSYFAGDSNSNLEVLQDILMTYVMYNFDLGYVQGMSDLLSPLLVLLNDEVDTFWCFVGFMNKVNRNFDLDQAGMKKQLQQLYCILCCIEPELANYLEQQESNNMTFCFRWLLVWFKREFSFDEINIMWEVLWTGMPCKNFHLLICAAILETEKDSIMSNNYGFTEILKHVNELARKINLDMILRKAEGIYIQLSTAANIPNSLREIIGLEPSSESDSDESSDEKLNKEENMSKAVNGVSSHSAPFVSMESPESAFDTSISLQYL